MAYFFRSLNVSQNSILPNQQIILANGQPTLRSRVDRCWQFLAFLNLTRDRPEGKCVAHKVY